MTPADTLREALRPFADFADPRNKIPPDTILTAGSAMARKQITMADCYAARDALAASEPVAGTVSLDAIRRTIADEWGSWVCYQDQATLKRTCDKDGHCRCADIARAIISQHALSAPHVQAARKRIARIIDPSFCFWDEEPPNPHQQRRADRALEKADAILALSAPAPAGREVLRTQLYKILNEEITPADEFSLPVHYNNAIDRILSTVTPQARGAARQFDDLKIAAETFRAAMITSGAINHVGQDQYFEELRALECALNPLNYRDATPPSPGAADRERNLRRLVIAARAVCFDNQGPDAIRALDKASEAFSELVAWENDPNDEVASANTGETGR